jgi:hypothetical protein
VIVYVVTECERVTAAVLESNGCGAVEQRFWCHRVMVLVLVLESDEFSRTEKQTGDSLWCYSGIKVVLQWCQRVSKWCYSGVRRYYSGVRE